MLTRHMQQQKEIPTTGPQAIEHALASLDIDKMDKDYHHLVRYGPKSKRAAAVKALNVIKGLKRNNMKPEQFMISSVPIIPPMFRPFSVIGDSFMPGNANELYRDMFQYRDMHKETADTLGEEGAAQTRLDLYDTVKAVFGFGESPTSVSSKRRGVSGFLKQITGTNPKYGFVQRKLLSKPQDSVSRGTIAVDPDLSLDEVGVPEEMAWTMYAPYIQRRLVRMGMSSGDALLNVKDRTSMALKALNNELEERPVVYSRSPSWHKFNVIAGRPKLTKGSTIMINPLITVGMNADFDGDAMALHVPSQPGAVKEAWEKLMPSKMLWSIKDPDRIMPQPKQEMILGLYTANRRQSKNSHQFATEADALSSIRSGKVKLSDDIQIGPPQI